MTHDLRDTLERGAYYIVKNVGLERETTKARLVMLLCSTGDEPTTEKVWVNVCYERNFRMAVERACDALNPMGCHGHSYARACSDIASDGMMIDPLVIWAYEDAELARKKASDALACEVTGYFEQVPAAKTNRSLLNDLADNLPKSWVGQRGLYKMLERLEDLNPTVRQPVKRRLAEDGDSQTEGWMQVIRPSKT